MGKSIKNNQIYFFKAVEDFFFNRLFLREPPRGGRAAVTLAMSVAKRTAVASAPDVAEQGGRGL